MIRNILTRIFSGESSPTSENKSASPTTAPPTQSLGISSVRDSFETTASKNSPQFDLGLVPSAQDSDAAKRQEQLMKDKEKLSQEQKKLEEAVHEKENNQDQDPFGNIFGFFGDDKGSLIEEKCRQHSILTTKPRNPLNIFLKPLMTQPMTLRNISDELIRTIFDHQ